MATYDRNDLPIEEWLERIDPRVVKRILTIGLPIVALVVAMTTSVYTVAPEGEALVKRFGAVVAQQPPGLHWKLPFGIDRAYFVPTQMVLKEEFGFRTLRADQKTTYDHQDYPGESLMLTGDLNVIDVDWVVQYHIRDPDLFLHRVRHPEKTIRDVSESVMRRIVGNRMGSNVLTVGRTEISQLAKEKLQTILDSYQIGVEINAVELKDVTPPRPVQKSYNDVNVAQQEREKLINQAEQERNRRVPRAEGEAQKLVAEAEAYAAERVNRAHGEAQRFTSIYEEYRNAPDVTRRRLYLETIDTVFPRLAALYVIEEGQPHPLPLLNLSPGPIPPLTEGGSR